MKTDLIFLLVVALYIGYYLCKKESFTENFAAIDDARQAVREIYNADIEAIRNLSEVSKRLQAGGLTHPGRLTVNAGGDHLPITAASNGEAHIALRSHNNEGLNNYLINRGGHFRLHTHGVGDVFGVNRDGHLYNEHHGDHVAHHVGRGGNPYITLSRAGQWGNSSWYLQNVHNGDPAKSIFRIGKHDVGSKLDIGSDGSLNTSGDIRFGATLSTNGRMHISGGELLYLLNKNGVIIGKEWGGNGNLVVQGELHTPNQPLFYTRYYNLPRFEWVYTDVPTHYKVISASKLSHSGKWENDDIFVRIVNGKWAILGHNARYGHERSHFPAVVTWALPSVVNTNFGGN
jgi:hypothetical protein